jgi:hypothetical protein
MNNRLFAQLQDLNEQVQNVNKHQLESAFPAFSESFEEFAYRLFSLVQNEEAFAMLGDTDQTQTLDFQSPFSRYGE